MFYVIKKEKQLNGVKIFDKKPVLVLLLASRIF